MRVKPNVVNGMTDMIVQRSESTEVNLVQTAMMGALTRLAMDPPTPDPSKLGGGLLKILSDDKGFLAEHLGGTEPIPPRTNLALGLSKTVNAFASSIKGDGAVSVWQAWNKSFLGFMVGNVKEFMGLFHEVANTFIANGGRLKFDLTGVLTSEEGVTTWELRQILKSPELRAKTDFFRDGHQLTGPQLKAGLKPWE